MDRSRRRSGFLIAATLGLAATAAAPGPPPLKAMRWLARDSDASVLLTRRPTECLALPRVAGVAYSVELGRAAFRDPLLLGGQAARAGIACESCHQNGRTNPDFQFPGLSGAPGTADVTSFLFSSHRGDHIDDPRPIPDLGGQRSARKVSRDPSSGALEKFIHGLITEEFDGPEPPPAVLEGLAAYVRSLDPANCPAARSEPLRVGQAVEDARRAVRAAAAALENRDAASAVVMLQAARTQLGAIAERYPGARLATIRQGIVAADLDLAAALDAVRAGPGDAGERLSEWLARSEEWAAAARRNESRSLYDRATLADAVSPQGSEITR